MAELNEVKTSEKNYGLENERVKTSFFYKILKRCFDVISSLTAIVVFSPLFLIISLIIKLDSKGKVIFSHKRLGIYGKEIKVYKFRTMVSNAEEVLNKMSPNQKIEFEKNFKLDNDPRVTRVGNILRKTSLDELPQLFNILLGNMSVVGPRPIIKKEVEKYGEYSNKLFSVKPGLTGMWQANGRSCTTYEQRVKMDMYYIDNRSFWLDIKLILKTVIVVIKREGAC